MSYIIAKLLLLSEEEKSIVQFRWFAVCSSETKTGTLIFLVDICSVGLCECAALRALKPNRQCETNKSSANAGEEKTRRTSRWMQQQPIIAAYIYSFEIEVKWEQTTKNNLFLCFRVSSVMLLFMRISENCRQNGMKFFISSAENEPHNCLYVWSDLNVILLILVCFFFLFHFEFLSFSRCARISVARPASQPSNASWLHFIRQHEERGHNYTIDSSAHYIFHIILSISSFSSCVHSTQ